MSRMTCLINFSGSSARSIMSFRLARIKVPTRSRSPMVMLLSNDRESRASPWPAGARFLKTKNTAADGFGDLSPSQICQSEQRENAEPPVQSLFLLQRDSHVESPVCSYF